MHPFSQIQPQRSIACIACSLLLLLSACEPKVAERGHSDLSTKAGSIIANQMTKQDVLGLMGSPSITSQFGQESWYYISTRKETTAFFRPELVEQEVLRISFEGDSAAQVEYYDKDQAQDVAISDRVTPTSGQEFGFVEQLIGNIGKFNKQQRDPLAGG